MATFHEPQPVKPLLEATIQAGDSQHEYIVQVLADLGYQVRITFIFPSPGLLISSLKKLLQLLHLPNSKLCVLSRAQAGVLGHDYVVDVIPALQCLELMEINIICPKNAVTDDDSGQMTQLGDLLPCTELRVADCTHVHVKRRHELVTLA